MKNNGNNKLPLKKKTTPNTKNNRSLWVLVVVVIAVAAGIFIWINKDNQNTKNSISTPSSIPANAKANIDLLVGRWTRTDSDGTYVIEIKNKKEVCRFLCPLNAGYIYKKTNDCLIKITNNNVKTNNCKIGI